MAKANVKSGAAANAAANARNKKKQLAQLDTATPPSVAVQKTVKMARGLAVEGQLVEALQAIAEAFDGLDEAKGIDPWEPKTLQAWSETQPRDVQHAASFVMSLGDAAVVFDVHAAMQVWDDMARIAFTSWAAKPWWATEVATT